MGGEVLVALHCSRLCLGDSIYVFRAAGRLHAITNVQPTPARTPPLCLLRQHALLMSFAVALPTRGRWMALA